MKKLIKKGFTLIEIMIVMAIIGLLSVVVIPKALPLRNQAKNNAVQSNVYIVRSFLENRAGADKVSITSSLGTHTDITSIATALNTIQGYIKSAMDTTFSGSSVLKNPFNNDTAINSTYVNYTDSNIGNSSVVIGYDANNGLPTDISSITNSFNKPGVTAIIVYKTGYVVYGVDSFGKIIQPTLVNMSNRVVLLPDINNPQTSTPTAPTTAALAVDLGTASTYAILAKTGISSVPNSVISGNIGVSPIASTAITGFSLTANTSNVFSTSTQVVGKVYASDYASPTPSNLTTAVRNMETAYIDAAGRAPNYTGLYTGDLSGKTLITGVYKWNTGVLINSDVTLSGGADDIFIFQVAGGITQATGTKIILTGGAQAKNIFWQSAQTVAINSNAHFEGTILCKTNITLGTNASINGKLLAQTAVTLIQNTIADPTFVAPLPPSNVDRVYNFLAINAAEKIIIGGAHGQVYDQIQGPLYDELSKYFKWNSSPNSASYNAIENPVITGYNQVVSINGTYIAPGINYSVFACNLPDWGTLDYSKYPGVVVVYPLDDVNNPGYCIYGIDAGGNKINERKLTLSALENSQTEINLSNNVNTVVSYLATRVKKDISDAGTNIGNMSDNLYKDIRKENDIAQISDVYVTSWKNITQIGSTTLVNNNSVFICKWIAQGNDDFSKFKGSVIINMLPNASGYEVYGINFNGDRIGYKTIQ